MINTETHRADWMTLAGIIADEMKAEIPAVAADIVRAEQSQYCTSCGATIDPEAGGWVGPTGEILSDCCGGSIDTAAPVYWAPGLTAREAYAARGTL